MSFYVLFLLSKELLFLCAGREKSALLTSKGKKMKQLPLWSPIIRMTVTVYLRIWLWYMCYAIGVCDFCGKVKSDVLGLFWNKIQKTKFYESFKVDRLHTSLLMLVSWSNLLTHFGITTCFTSFCGSFWVHFQRQKLKNSTHDIRAA